MDKYNWCVSAWELADTCACYVHEYVSGGLWVRLGTCIQSQMSLSVGLSTDVYTGLTYQWRWRSLCDPPVCTSGVCLSLL